MVNNNVEKAKALELIQDSARNYLTAKIKLPLGNPDLKKVHTNQFLWTQLPKKLPLKNWEAIAEVFQGQYTRYQGSKNSGYTVNRWYIEGTTIDVDLENGKAEMSLDLNAFPSSMTSYRKGYRDSIKSYTDAVNKKNQASNNSANKNTTSSTKTTTNATSKKTLLNKKWIKKYKIPKEVYNLVSKICNIKNSVLANVKAIFKWFKKNFGYELYYNSKYSLKELVKRKKGNCVDSSRLFCAMCQSIGVSCNYVQNRCTVFNGKNISHQYNRVYIDGKGVTVDVGCGTKRWGSNGGGHGSCGKEVFKSWGD